MFDYSLQEKEEVLNKFFIDKDKLIMIRFPKKLKQKYLCLLWIITLFDTYKAYSEKEVNQILEPVLDDYVMIRRYLVDYGLLKRELDGSKYWVNNN
ncbi:DUF2087 domain-containing protein [Hujiaoplasma nucleasis]|uniref:DUF2087 domain-containing protein n=1 Tax=Hujiaoplasma nucleasis TaxID=2725268 RepID=A0A7L6N406_9MOLU|nr:DUF2087 domain-containing protein [Hujiaoplasma nucleasis]QLY39967.1 DUF2087 domain-containing protein [Hujiaoplasma nucleasis]